jgi:dephospho-CoA kinase
MLKLGITGGIGSGKSTACRLFELSGIPVYYADPRAKALMNEDVPLRKALIKTFGEKVYTAQQELNRAHLSALVFNNPTKLQQLNALVHPAVAKDYDHWHKQQKNVPYTLKEAALLFESGSYKQLDAVIVVNSPLELRIARTMQRDGSTREAILQRINNQLSDKERNRLGQYFLQNDEEHSLIEQVVKLHQQLLEKSAG